jgi:hypothetical protein
MFACHPRGRSQQKFVSQHPSDVVSARLVGWVLVPHHIMISNHIRLGMLSCRLSDSLGRKQSESYVVSPNN